MSTWRSRIALSCSIRPWKNRARQRRPIGLISGVTPDIDKRIFYHRSGQLFLVSIPDDTIVSRIGQPQHGTAQLDPFRRGKSIRSPARSANAEYFHQAAGLPGAPDYVGRFAAVVSERAGDLETSLYLWRELALRTDNPKIRVWAEGKMEEIAAEIEASRRARGS